MRRRIFNKIQDRMLVIDEDLADLLRLTYELPIERRGEITPIRRVLQRQIQYLKRRWPQVYYKTFYWGDFA